MNELIENQQEIRRYFTNITDHLVVLGERALKWLVVIACLVISCNMLLMGVIISTW